MTLEILGSNPALEPMLRREEKRSKRLAYDAAHPYVPATTLIMHCSTAELTFMDDMFVHVHMSPESCSSTRHCREPFVIQPPVQLHLKRANDLKLSDSRTFGSATPILQTAPPSEVSHDNGSTTIILGALLNPAKA